MMFFMESIPIPRTKAELLRHRFGWDDPGPTHTRCSPTTWPSSKTLGSAGEEAVGAAGQHQTDQGR